MADMHAKKSTTAKCTHRNGLDLFGMPFLSLVLCLVVFLVCASAQCDSFLWGVLPVRVNLRQKIKEKCDQLWHFTAHCATINAGVFAKSVAFYLVPLCNS